MRRPRVKQAVLPVIQIPPPIQVEKHIRQHSRGVKGDPPEPNQRANGVLVGVRKRQEVRLHNPVVRLHVPASCVLTEFCTEDIAGIRDDVAGDVAERWSVVLLEIALVEFRKAQLASLGDERIAEPIHCGVRIDFRVETPGVLRSCERRGWCRGDGRR